MILPKKEITYWDRFNAMCAKAIGLSILTKKDIDRFRIEYRDISELLEKGDYNKAHEKMGNFMMEIQRKRAM